MFIIKLKTKKPLNELLPKKFKVKEYDEDLDDGRSVIIDICEIFRDSEEILFIVSGFGQENWPVDCSCDLSSIVEQLPAIMRKINNNDYNFELDFYEQGIEREIQFKENEYCVSLVCRSRTNWRPIPDKIDMKQEDIRIMFEELYKSFLYYGEKLCFELINHPMLKEWMKL